MALLDASGIATYKDWVLSIEQAQNSVKKMDLLWENADPTSDFAAQDIAVDLSNYDGAIVEFINYKTRQYRHRTRPVPIYGGDATATNAILDGYNSGRCFTVMPDKIMFDTGWNHGTTASPGRSVPVAIYGVTGACQIYVPQETGWRYLLTKRKAVGNPITGFRATRDWNTNTGTPVYYCGWRYTEAGTGFTLCANPTSYSEATMVSNEAIDLTFYSSLIAEIGIRAGGGDNMFALIAENDLPSDYFTIMRNKTQQRSVFAMQTVLSDSSAFKRVSVNMDISGLSGKYYIAGHCNGSNISEYGKLCIMEVRVQ